MDNTPYLKFQGDELYLITPLPQYGIGIAQTQLVMTKEIFIECYKRWIEEEGEKDSDSVKPMSIFEQASSFMAIPDACQKCSNHPTNGGSGICYCTLGSIIITWGVNYDD